jgi:hypothetical protein
VRDLAVEGGMDQPQDVANRYGKSARDVVLAVNELQVDGPLRNGIMRNTHAGDGWERSRFP